MTVPVVVVAGATGRIGGAVARAVLARGGRVAAAVRKPWQVDKLRSALASDRARRRDRPPCRRRTPRARAAA
ncbi:MAG: NmrA family NAD(P)-binding protein, partial [Planctomycetota bacterium]